MADITRYTPFRGLSRLDPFGRDDKEVLDDAGRSGAGDKFLERSELQADIATDQLLHFFVHRDSYPVPVIAPGLLRSVGRRKRLALSRQFRGKASVDPMGCAPAPSVWRLMHFATVRQIQDRCCLGRNPEIGAPVDHSIGIFFVLLPAFFASSRLSTPFSYFAFTPDSSAACGSVKERYCLP